MKGLDAIAILHCTLKILASTPAENHAIIRRRIKLEKLLVFAFAYSSRVYYERTTALALSPIHAQYHFASYTVATFFKGLGVSIIANNSLVMDHRIGRYCNYYCYAI